MQRHPIAPRVPSRCNARGRRVPPTLLDFYFALSLPGHRRLSRLSSHTQTFVWIVWYALSLIWITLMQGAPGCGPGRQVTGGDMPVAQFSKPWRVLMRLARVRLLPMRRRASTVALPASHALMAQVLLARIRGSNRATCLTYSAMAGLLGAFSRMSVETSM